MITRTWFVELVKVAYYKANGSLMEIDELPYVPTDRSSWALITRAWEKISYVTLGLYGPYLLIGFFNLSDVLSGLGALYIEHVVSNFYIPAFIYMAWQYFSLIVQEEEMAFVQAFAAFMLYEFYSFLWLGSQGINAVYYLNGATSSHADDVLAPSLFYLLNWIDHTPRV